MHKYYGGIAILSVLVGLVAIGGIIQTGGPFSAKNVKLDEERLNNFRAISTEINLIYSKTRRLPANLKYVDENKSKPLKLVDPETKKEYEYKILTANSYTLCTEFSTDSFEVSKKYEDYYFYDSNRYKNIVHKKGYDCVTYDINNSSSRNLNNNEEDYYDEIDEYEFEDVYEIEAQDPYTIKNIKLNTGWFDKNDNVQYTLTNAYLSPNLNYDGDDYSAWMDVNDNDVYLVLEVEVENTGLRDFYIVTEEVLRLEKDGKRLVEDDYSDSYSNDSSDQVAYSMFLVDKDEDNFKILFGDLQSPQSIDLNFNSAQEIEGSLDIYDGFESI